MHPARAPINSSLGTQACFDQPKELVTSKQKSDDAQVVCSRMRLFGSATYQYGTILLIAFGIEKGEDVRKS